MVHCIALGMHAFTSSFQETFYKEEMRKIYCFFDFIIWFEIWLKVCQVAKMSMFSITSKLFWQNKNIYILQLY